MRQLTCAACNRFVTVPWVKVTTRSRLGGRPALSQHRTPFTASRFVPIPTENDYGPTFAPGVLLGLSSTEQSHSYSPDRTPRYSESADQATERPRTRQEDRHLRSAPKAKKSFGYAAPDLEPESAPAKRRGAHRLPAPPAALKGRAAVVAVAAGAVVAAGQAAVADGPAKDTKTSEATLAAASVDTAASGDTAASVDITAAPQAAQFMGTSDAVASAGSASNTPQVLNVATPVNIGEFSNLLAKGQKFAQERAAAEAAKLRPLFAQFATGNFTSGFGARWGTLHGGVDIANAIGTPILAVADGEVIDAGAAAGFGMWVRLKHADGTVTVYGHIDSATVTVGQRVMAGDEIAKMGNRGFSTGPHVHFEVWLNGTDKVDPMPWLASRGISLGPARD